MRIFIEIFCYPSNRPLVVSHTTSGRFDEFGTIFESPPVVSKMQRQSLTRRMAEAVASAILYDAFSQCIKAF